MPDPAAAMATPASTSFDLLGPLVVTVAGSAVRLGGPRQVAVLARLLLAPGQVVSMEQLAESVWDGDLPARPEVAIRSYISNLRRSIEPARPPGDRQSCIESIPPGYRLAVDPGAIDAHRFELLVAQGRSALGRDEAAVAATHLASALRLWRGEPCEGLVDTDALMGYRSRLAELRLVATEQWFEARLALGEHEALMPDLEAVLGEHPRRERLTELAMLALYRAGRQSEALAACHRLRSLLLEQLGIDPGPRVQALEHKILTHDPSLLAGAGAPPSAAAEGAEPATPPVAGAPAAGVEAGPDGVDPGPGVGPDLVLGRTRELAVLAGLEVALDQGRSATVVLTGEPGSGKSALLGRAADRGASAGATVAWGRCREVAQAQVLWPWMQILQHLAADHGAADGAAGEAAGLDGAPPRDPGEAAALFPAIVRYLRRLAAERPILVVMDDAQWADEASLELLAFAGPALHADRVAFAVAWRHTETGPSPARRALRDLIRLPGLHRIELAGIPVEAVAELVATVRPDLPQPAVLAPALHRATAGNPFLVRQMLEAATDTGVPGPWPPDHDELLATLLAPAPSTLIQDQMALRAERAHPAAPAVLTVAALSRTPLTAEVVAEAVELPLAEAEEALEQSVQAGLLVADSPQERTYRFVHPVAARALTAALTGPRLARLHAALGHARWRAGGPPAELVHHFARARSAGTALLAARFALLALHESTSFELLAEAEGLAAANLEVLSALDGAEGLGAELALLEAQVARLRGEPDRQLRASALARSLARRAGGPGAEALAVLAAAGPQPAGPAFAAVAWDGGCSAGPGEPTAPATGLSGAGPAVPAADHGWWGPVLAVRQARTGRSGAVPLADPVLVPGRAGEAEPPPGWAAALWRERALTALERGTDDELVTLARTCPAGPQGAGHHDLLLARRLALLAGADVVGPDQPPSSTGADPEDGRGPTSEPAGPPRSVLDLDRVLTALAAELAGGAVGATAAELSERLGLWSSRTGIAPDLIRWLRCLVLWERGRMAELEACAAGGAGAGPLLVWQAVAAAEGGASARACTLLDRALEGATGVDGDVGLETPLIGALGGGAGRDLDVELEAPLDLRASAGPEPDPAPPATRPVATVGAVDRWGRAECCLLVLSAARAGHRAAVEHLGHRLVPGPSVAAAFAGLGVVGPVDWFRGLGALASGDAASAAALFERAETIARLRQAPAWRIRAQAGLSGAAAASGAGGLQSTSNRFATR